nr:hypothetical protein [uncultured Granulicatella sp.]
MKEQRNSINKIINKLKRATTEEEKVLLYTFFHDDLLEALVDVHVLLTNLIRLESAILRNEDEIVEIYYKNKFGNHENGEMYLKTIETYKLLAKTLKDEQVEMLDDFEDSWIELSRYNEKQAVMDGCRLAFSSTQSILKG